MTLHYSYDTCVRVEFVVTYVTIPTMMIFVLCKSWRLEVTKLPHAAVALCKPWKLLRVHALNQNIVLAHGSSQLIADSIHV